MEIFKKPQSPMEFEGTYFYPLTTCDQIILDNNNRLSEEMIFAREIDSEEVNMVPINADTLNGKLEGQLSVANATKLNNKTEDMLNVANAARLNDKTEGQLSVANATKLNNKTEDMLNVANASKLGGNTIDALKALIANSIYPVGSIYMSVSSENPSTLFGGTWEQIAQGRTLFGADGSSYVAGNTIEAGLPNITGTHSTNRYSGWEISGTGAFSGSTSTRSVMIDNGDNTNTPTFIADFDASKSNAIYGNSTTVQPPAFVVYMWKRTA